MSWSGLVNWKRLAAIAVVIGGAAPLPAGAACNVGRAVLESRATTSGYLRNSAAHPRLLDQDFRVTDYGERLELRFDPEIGAHRTIGFTVARVEGILGVIFVGTVLEAMTRTHVSWARLSEIPDGIRWLPKGTPPLLNASGEAVEVGEPAFPKIVSGPLEGIDLVLLECRT